MMNNRLKKALYYIVPAALTVVITLIVFVIKGVYPFGDSDIAYYDMNAQYVPNYARNYEIFHGQESPFFDWLAGCGMDMTGIFANYTLHPINWMLFFVKPDHVLQFMALFLAIKLVICSLSVSVYLKKVYDQELILHTAMCIIYTFCGFTVQQYVNIFFLDSMMTFPLLLLSLRGMKDNKGFAAYTALLALQLLTSWYMGFFTLLFLLFYSFSMSFIINDKGEKKVFAARVGIYTLLALLISAATALPSFLGTLSSSRFTDYNNSFFDLFNAIMPESRFRDQKLFTVFNLEFVAALLLIVLYCSLVKKKELANRVKPLVFMLVILLVPIFNEGSHLLWMGGSYGHFPYRFGYMFTLVALEITAELWKIQPEIPSMITKKRSLSKLFIPIGVILFVVQTVLLVKMSSTFMEHGIYKGGGSHKLYGMVFFISVCAYLIFIIFSEKEITKRVFFIVSVLNSAVVAVGFIAPMDSANEDHYLIKNNAVVQAVELRNGAKLTNDNLSRVKALYPILTRNYSMILGTPSISQWTASTPEYQKEVTRLGYGATYTFNYDWGGTAFSDAFLNHKKLIVYKDNDVYVPEELYTEYSHTENFGIYDMKYTLPFGILTNEEILSLDTFVNNDALVEEKEETTDESEENKVELFDYLEHQTNLANVLTHNNNELLYEIPTDSANDIAPINSMYKYSYTYDLHFDKPAALYASLAKNTYVTVNGKEYIRPGFENDPEQTAEDEGLGIVLVGVYKAGDDVSICVSNRTGTKENDRFALLDLTALEKLCDKYKNSCAKSFTASKNHLDIIADVEENNYMFLPLEYLEGWSAEVNGQKADIYPVMNNAFMAIKLPAGHCEIIMKFRDIYLGKGAIVSIFAIAVTVLLFVLGKRGTDITKITFLGNAAYIMLNITAIAALIILDILPIVL